MENKLDGLLSCTCEKLLDLFLGSFARFIMTWYFGNLFKMATVANPQYSDFNATLVARSLDSPTAQLIIIRTSNRKIRFPVGSARTFSVFLQVTVREK